MQSVNGVWDYCIIIVQNLRKKKETIKLGLYRLTTLQAELRCTEKVLTFVKKKMLQLTNITVFIIHQWN